MPESRLIKASLLEFQILLLAVAVIVADLPTLHGVIRGHYPVPRRPVAAYYHQLDMCSVLQPDAQAAERSIVV